MPTLINSTKAVLAFLSVSAIYATWYMLLNNGTAEHLAHTGDVGPRMLSGTKEPLRTVYTGVPAIDHQLTVLVLFFWENLDGSNPSGSLFGFHFVSQNACGWGLLMMEALRHGNQWTAISFVGIWGIFVQIASYAVVIPIWCIVYLSTSRIVSSRRVSDFLVDVPNLAGIAISIVLGFVVPTVLMVLPAPLIVNHDLKQRLMTFWQLFPVWVSLTQGVVPYMLPKLGEASGESTTRTLRSMRALYAGLLVTAGISQVSTMTLVATSKFFPALFAPEFVGVFNPSSVFVPAAVSPSTKMPSIGRGAFLLLQYDQFIGSTAIALWSTVLLINTYRSMAIKPSVALMIVGGITVMALTGPSGYVTACIWARDELIVANAQDDAKKVE